jgi:DNA-directed RNA polymerase specialized sigma24 family protein
VNAVATSVVGGFDALFRAQQGWLVRHLATRVDRRDVDLAEDLAQQVLLEAARYLPAARFTDPAGAAARAWLTTIARHVLYHHYQHNPGRRGAYEVSVDPTETWRACWAMTPAPDVADQAVTRADLVAATSADPQAGRLLRMRGAGWTWERIGAALGQDRNALRMRLDLLMRAVAHADDTATEVLPGVSDQDRARALVGAGAGRAELAATLGISTFAARQLLVAARATGAPPFRSGVAR